MEAQLDGLGWNDALEAFTSERDIPAGALTFNWERLWQHCLEVYDLEERLSGVYAFFR